MKLFFSKILLIAIILSPYMLAAQTTHIVNVGPGMVYTPSELTIEEGDIVTWIILGGFHDVNFDINTITGESFGNPPEIADASLPVQSGAGEMGSITFESAGTYNYDCSVGSHAMMGMTGIVTVTPADEDYCTIADTDLPQPFNWSTGNNMTLLIEDSFVELLPINSDNPYIVALSESGQVYGSSDLSEDIGYESQVYMDFAVWGDDPTTPEVDGFTTEENIYFQLVDGNNLYDVIPTYENIEGDSPVYSPNSFGGLLDGIELISPNCGSQLGCMNSNYCNYNPDAEVDDGSCEGIPGCMDISYTEYDSTSGCNNQALCLITWLQEYLLSQDTISMVNDLNNSLEEFLEQEQINHLNTQAELDLANQEIADLQSQLNLCNENLDYWSSPITIDLQTGWNIIGYTLKTPQDLVATFEPIIDIIYIIKNNGGEVYWPEFGFSNINELIPGQGYQIKVNEAYLGFTYPDVSGQRIELTPTVPSWAIDMEVEMHPNDIRTLVRVVNMLGQEVDPEMEPRGSVLLYLYNDSTVEKKLVE